MKRSLLLIVGLLLPFCSLHAQNPSDSDAAVFSPSIYGEKGFELGSGIAFQMALNAQVGERLVVSYSADVRISSLYENVEPRQDITTHAIMLGSIKKHESALSLYSFGLAFGMINNRGKL